MTTRLFTSNASSRFDAPELSLLQKKIRRMETLLLDLPSGVFLSSISNYLTVTESETKSLLIQLGAQAIGGFWVHPHYLKNKNISNSNLPNVSAIGCALVKDKNITISDLMKTGNIYKTENLITALKTIVDNEVSNTELQIVASQYLFIKLNVKYRVLHHN